MTPDSSAKYYQWFMTEDHTQRIVGFEWFPDNKGPIGMMSTGKLTFSQREEPGDTWGPPRVVSVNVPWTVAKQLANNQGFNVEIAVKE